MILYRDIYCFFFFFQAEDGIRDYKVTGVQTCALPIYPVEVRRLLQRDPDPLIVGQGRTRTTECAAAEPGQGGGGAPRGWAPSRIPPAPIAPARIQKSPASPWRRKPREDDYVQGKFQVFPNRSLQFRFEVTDRKSVV